MARNMKDANAGAFDAFKSRVSAHPFDNVARWIKTSEDEKAWLKDVRWLGDFRFDSHNWIVNCALHGQIYYLLVGFSVSDVGADGSLNAESLNAGLLTVLLSEQDVVRPDVSEVEIVDAALIPTSGEYEGHDWQDLLHLCRPMSLFSASSGSPFSGAQEESLARAALLFAASSGDLRSLAYSSQSLARCMSLAVDFGAKVPWGVIAYALVAARWDHAYLDIYRCIERLFPLPRMRELTKVIGLASPGLALSADIERVLGWRQQEEAGMAALFEARGELCVKFFERYRPHWGDAPAELAPAGLAQHFYKLRNAIVHFRPVTQQAAFTEERWVMVVDHFIEFVSEIYAEYSRDL